MSNGTPRGRWVLAFLSILIVLSVVLHVGQVVPAPADLGTLPALVSGHSDSPCESGQHLKAMHCSMVTGCSLYAPLEASAGMLIADKAHALPSGDAVQVRWPATPQLQPPRYSLSI